VAGVDISLPDANGKAVGTAVLLELSELQVVEAKVYKGKQNLPYVPGLPSFRETPLVLGAPELLEVTPNVVLVDG